MGVISSLSLLKIHYRDHYMLRQEDLLPSVLPVRFRRAFLLAREPLRGGFLPVGPRYPK